MSMIKQVVIRCKNNGKTLKVDVGSTLQEIYDMLNAEESLGLVTAPVCAKVNNKTEGLHFRVYNAKTVEFMDLTSSTGSRVYTRTLFLVLCKAVHDLYPEGSVKIDIPVSNGYYCDLEIGHVVTPDDASAIREKMREIIDAGLPINRRECLTEEAIDMFEKLGAHSKVELLRTIGKIYTIYYELDGYKDYYYGSMLTNTKELTLFGLEPYYDGLLLRIPSISNPSKLGEFVRQDKMFDIFREHHQWQNILGIGTIGALNQEIVSGNSAELINLSEALQEKKISRIADEIASRKGIKLVLIAGPSSSGKTTTCKRLSIQLLTNGIRPIGISLDDYFVDREKTPRDEKGDYDYESIHALNLDLFNEQLEALFKGEEVELPRYDFPTGTSVLSGKKLRMQANDVLVIEGIHALNPELTASIPQDKIFRVYASALTTVLLDHHNYIPTTDNRLLRRIIRDYKYRGCSAQETIRRWPSVRAGENKWIFPYQENADAMFNTAMLFELAVIKTQAEPLLEQVPESADEYNEAYRLLKFLKYIKPLSESQIPPASLLREFLGGSSFVY